MFCVNCGKQLNEGAAFCSHCGAKQPVIENRSFNGNQADGLKEESSFQYSNQSNMYQQVIPPASVIPEGQEAEPVENNTGLIVLIIILIALIIIVGILSFAYLYGFIAF